MTTEVAPAAPNLLGCDFSSSPSRRKPIMLAQGRRKGEAVTLAGILSFDTLPGFGQWLAQPGDWVGGEFWGPLASETRNWLDFVATGRPCALATAREARSNLAITLAIEEAVASGKTVRLSETAVAR